MRQARSSAAKRKQAFSGDIQDALKWQQQGNLDRAERRYKEILAKQPHHFDAKHMLGVVRSQQGRNGEALELLRAALQINPESAPVLSNLGLVLGKVDRPDEALACYDKALAIKPDYAEALFNRGAALLALRRPEEALACYDKAVAIKRDFVEAFCNRGNLLLEMRRGEEALASYDKALAIKSDHADALNGRGNALRELGRLEEALASYDRAIAAKPDAAGALNNRGNALLELGRQAEALESYDRALAIRPDYADALNGRGNALRDVGPMEEALASYDKAVAVARNAVGALNNRANALRELGRCEEALETYDRALEVNPDYAEAINGRGNVLKDLGRFEEAMASYDKALAMRPGDAEILFNCGLLDLLLGDFPSGWSGYETRWDRAKPEKRRLIAPYPVWKGENLSGKRIVIYEEQGLGDIIQFSRYVPKLSQLGAQAAFLVRPHLHRLLRSFLPSIRLIDRRPEDESFDYQCPLMSLPAIFGAGLHNIPADVPYLRAEPQLIAKWRERIGGHGLKVGICWQGNPTGGIDRGRSIQLRHFKALSAIPDVRLISLQKQHGLDQLAELKDELRIETLGADFDAGADAFVDTAAVMLSLDLIVTSDTSIAHLAGALGRPVWVALKLAPDWRWLLHRSDSPWYPAMTLYRQNTHADWDGVFERIAGDLARFTPVLVAPIEADPLQEAIGFHQQGNFVEAERRYKEILDKQPGHFDAKHLLGVLRSQQNRNSEALALISDALQTEPNSAPALSNLALVLGKLSRRDEALAHCDKALAIKPDFVDALNNRGAALREMKRLEEALASYDEALAIKPDYADALYNRGNTLKDLGRGEEAVTSYDKALAIRPNHADAFNNRGNTLLEIRRPAEALASFDKALAIQPDNAEALNGRGNALKDLGRIEDALASYDRAIAVKPDAIGALNNRGISLKQLGRSEQAVASYDRLLTIKPDYVEAHFNRGNALRDLGRQQDAIASYDKALAIQPDYAEALNNRGNAFLALGRRAEALASYNRALAVKPDYVDALNNRGNALLDLERPEEAVASYDAALSYKPDYAEALSNRGPALAELGRPKEALASYDRALALRPGYIDALYNRGLLCLLLGDFPSGWKGYENRWLRSDATKRRLSAPYPAWKGEDISGKRIIVDEEQGFGDILQFCRYVPKLCQLGAQVTFLVRPSLHRLFRPAMPAVRLVDKPDGEILDYQSALLDLPARFGTGLQNVPADVPYLRPEPELVAKWRERIGGHGLKVGICWQGNPTGKIDIGRSIPLRCFKRLSAIPNVRLISLQKQHGLDQLAALKGELNVETLGADFDAGADAFIDTAAVMSRLDLIVTSDTSIAHLAGALGRPVWLALRWVPDWRWMLDRSDSPWYPSMTLYRQSKRDDWDGVFERIARDLAGLSPGAGMEDAVLREGIGFHQQGDFAEAERRYREILAKQPDHFDAKHLLGVVRLQQGRHEEAFESIGAALQTNPNCAVALSNMGLVLSRLGRPEEALANCAKALAIDPNLADAYNNRGAAFRELSRIDEALASYDKAIALNPNFADAFNNRGNALREIGRNEEALASYDKALALKSNFADAFTNRGAALMDLGRYTEAVSSYDKALAIKPGYAEAAFNRGLLALLLGDFSYGWSCYERRWEPADAPKRKLMASYPVWKGEDISGKRIIVFEEQGLGDIIHFSRYFSKLSEIGADVTFLVRRSLHRLLSSFVPGIRLIDERSEGESFDYQCALLSLPGAFKTALDSIPAAIPYLRPEPDLIAKWRERIGGHGCKVGICWQGSPSGKIDRGRSIPLRCFQALSGIPDVRLISLQKEYGLDQLAELKDELKIETLGADFDAGADAFIDTAAVMLSLDLIVTSDTSIAHLAGALGRPVWVALKFTPDWRWLLHRSDSPWYPAMTLYRQNTSDDWDGVFERIARDLSGFSPSARRKAAAQVDIPGSIGELFDKITILEIKAARIADPEKLRNVSRELRLLRALEARYQPLSDDESYWVDELKRANEALWEIEDAIRECELRNDFGAEFIDLARSVYKTNDRRAALKKQINVSCGSSIVEEKSYAGGAS